MKFILAALLALAFSTSAEARGKPVLVGLGDTVGVVATLDAADHGMMDFPADATYGYYKDTFTLFFVPVVSWGGEPVVASESDESVWTLEGESLAYFEEKYGVAADEYGGWAKFCNFVTGIVVAVLGFLKLRSMNSDDHEEEEA